MFDPAVDEGGKAKRHSQREKTEKREWENAQRKRRRRQKRRRRKEQDTFVLKCFQTTSSERLAPQMQEQRREGRDYILRLLHVRRQSVSISSTVFSETEPLLLPILNGQESSISGATSGNQFKEEELVPVLRRHLTLFDGISVLLGVMIGSGIFASPGEVLQDTGSVGLGFIAWLAAVFMALCSALVYAELGAAMPQAGGNAYYFKVAFGDAISFSFIWTMFFVLINGSLALVAITFARYFLIAITGADSTEINMDSDCWSKAIAIACVVVLIICNCFGVAVTKGLQNIISLIKIVLILLLAVAAGVSLWGSTDVLQTNLHQPFAGSTPSGFGLGSLAALWAFSGGGDIVYLSEEMKNPAKNIPRVTIGGVSLVAVIYLIINFIYLCILPASEVKLSSVIAIDATKTALGPWAGLTTALLVAVSVLGVANAIILYGSRYLYAAARGGQVPRMLTCLKLLGQQSGAPYVALLAQGTICVLLLLQSSAFVGLLAYFGIASFLFQALTGAALIRLRYSLPDLHRPYSVTFYPLAPLVTISFSLYLVVSTFVSNPPLTSLALAFIAVSFPVYFLFVRGPQPYML